MQVDRLARLANRANLLNELKNAVDKIRNILLLSIHFCSQTEAVLFRPYSRWLLRGPARCRFVLAQFKILKEIRLISGPCLPEV